MQDMLHPEVPECFTLRDLRRGRTLAGAMFNILFNLGKFVAYETRDPFVVRQEKAEEPEATEWDRCAPPLPALCRSYSARAALCHSYSALAAYCRSYSPSVTLTAHGEPLVHMRTPSDPHAQPIRAGAAVQLCAAGVCVVTGHVREVLNPTPGGLRVSSCTLHRRTVRRRCVRAGESLSGAISRCRFARQEYIRLALEEEAADDGPGDGEAWEQQAEQLLDGVSLAHGRDSDMDAMNAPAEGGAGQANIAPSFLT